MIRLHEWILAIVVNSLSAFKYNQTDWTTCTQQYMKYNKYFKVRFSSIYYTTWDEDRNISKMEVFKLSLKWFVLK